MTARAWSSVAFGAVCLVSGALRAQDEAWVVEDGVLRAALRRYAHEPTVDEAVTGALRVARLDPELASRAAARARRSGWVPEVRVGARRGQQVDLSSLAVGTAAGRTQLETGDRLAVEAELTFRLADIVYGRDEVGWARERRALAEARIGLVRTVVGLYFERRRLQLERDLLGRSDLPRVMRIAELTAMLDALCGGLFERGLPGRPRPGARR
ncbi:MAG: hypothetical protein NZ898_10980 [Myxococcota bacterium]|nr:hypothetical protein [Myxococcota bacterium]MDW8362420.1 hypothetical protein [Myxococcales bacterium]